MTKVVHKSMQKGPGPDALQTDEDRVDYEFHEWLKKR